MPFVRPATETMSHSRPFAACAVRICTAPSTRSVSPAVESALLRLGRLEEREERRECRALRLGGEPRGRLGERIEMRTGEAGVAGPHGDLDVETHLALDVGDQIGQRLVEALPQPAQLVGERRHPRVALRREPIGVVVAQIVQRVDQRRLVQPAGQQRLLIRLGPVAGRPTARLEIARAPVERDQVARTDAPPRAGQQPQQGRAGQRVGEHVQGADDVTDLGRVEQAAEADHLDRQPDRPQRLLDRDDLLTGTDENRARWAVGHRDRREVRVRCEPGAVAPGGRDLVGDPGRLVLVRLQQCAADGRRAERIGRRR